MTDEASRSAENTASDRAQVMRASLSALGDAEAMLAEASQARRAAATDAESMVAEAELLAEQLLAEANATAEKAGVEAQERSEGILARARAEASELTAAAQAKVDDLKRNADQERARLRSEVAAENRAELESLRGRSVALVNEIETQVAGLRPSLETALAALSDVMAAIELARDEAASIEPNPSSSRPLTAVPDAPEADQETPEPEEAVAAEGSVAPQETAGAVTREVSVVAATLEPASSVLDSGEALEASHVEADEAGANDANGARPLGWLFRAAQN